MSQVLASLSRWLVGSSSSSTSLPAKRMRASSTRRRSPPDSTAEGQVDAVGAEAQAGDQLADLGLRRVAAEGREGVLGLGEAGDGPLGRVLLHGDAQLLQIGRRPRPGLARTGRGPARSRRWRARGAGGPG